MSTVQLPEAGSAATQRPSRSRRGPLFWVAVVVLAAIVVVTVAGQWLAPYDPVAGIDLRNPLSGSTPQHWLGTDQSGRDTFSRLLLGARTSMLGALGVIALATLLGVSAGVTAAWRGGWTDRVISRVSDAVYAFPGILFVVLVVAILDPGLLNAVVALGIAFAPSIARITRNVARSERARPYIEAYRVQGFAGATICLRHLLPNIAPVVLGYVVTLFGYALMDLAALSYLGFGTQPPTPDWGLMVQEGQDVLTQGVFLPALAPGIAIAVTVVAVNVVGAAVADRLNGEASS